MLGKSASIHALGLALAVTLGGLCDGLAQNGAVPQDSPFLTRNTIAEFLQSAPGRIGGMGRVQGTVVFQENRAIIVQDRTGGLLLEANSAKSLPLGTSIEAVGIITRGVSSSVLQNASVRTLRAGPPPVPLPVTADRLLQGDCHMRLIHLNGRLLGREQQGTALVLRLRSGQVGFQAQLDYALPGDPLGYLKPGSVLRLTGICNMERDGAGTVRGFQLMLRSPRDVLVMDGPTWWTADRIAWIAGGAILLAIAAAGWVFTVRWRVKRLTDRIRSEVRQQGRHTHEDLEQRIQERTAQLQAANRELEAFAYTISHDMRAPLRAVEGFASLVQNELRPEHQSPEVKHALEVIRGSALRMSQLIEDLLEFARLGRIEASMNEVNLESLVWSVYEELKVQIGTRAVEFEVHRLPPVYGDSGMTRQLVTNLLSNAIKYTRPRDVAKIEVGSFDEDGETVYFVKDNGVGFDMRYASKLFGVFHRLHSDKRFEGTGVGLAIVHRILERHHGRIWVQSEIDQGTTFYFTIGKPPPEVQPTAQATEPLSKVT